jgi:hypothetical protein
MSFRINKTLQIWASSQPESFIGVRRPVPFGAQVLDSRFAFTLTLLAAAKQGSRTP